MTEAEELELLELEEQEAKAKAAPRVAAAPYVSPDDKPTTVPEALAGHAADNIPFAKQMGALIAAAKMKAAGSPMKFGENYDQLLLAEQRQLERSKKESPWLSRLGAGAGFVGSAAALPGSGVPALAGLGGLFGLSDATANPGASLGDIALRTGLSAVAAPVIGKAAEAVAPWVGSKMGQGADYLGSKAEALAGFLKTHSIHPNPTLAEKMESLPGGEIGVGKKLLELGIGGATKRGTAEQISAAMDAAGSNISKIAEAHDAAGGSPIDIGPALDKAQAYAGELARSPLHEDAANQLGRVLSKYEAIYRDQPATAAEAVALKRELADVAYSKAKLAAVGDTTAGKYGVGLSKFERAVDDALDESLGSKFPAANLEFRQLMEAGKAAARSAARTQGNAHLIGGLIPSVVGGGVMASGHGGPEAIAAGLASALLQKYGSQAGARIAYSPVAGGLQLVGRGLNAADGGLAGRAGAEVPTSLADLIRSYQRDSGFKSGGPK